MEGYIGEVKLFSGTYPPKGWAYCQGQILPIQQYAALYSVMGNQYGGDGINNFALPDLQGRICIGPGQGDGLTYRHPGEKSGSEKVQITDYSMPAHTHSVQCDMVSGTRDLSSDPQNRMFGKLSDAARYGVNETGNPTMKQDMLSASGSSQIHENMPPFNCLNYIICIMGNYPPRS